MWQFSAILLAEKYFVAVFWSIVESSRDKIKSGPEQLLFSAQFIAWMIFWPISSEDWSHRTDKDGNKNSMFRRPLGLLEQNLSRPHSKLRQLRRTGVR